MRYPQRRHVVHYAPPARSGAAQGFSVALGAIAAIVLVVGVVGGLILVMLTISA